MRATGIVRRIDDLGRVVIPKEIRRTLGIKEGDPLEVFVTNEGEVVFQKYNTDLSEDVSATDDYVYIKREELNQLIKQKNNF